MLLQTASWTVWERGLCAARGLFADKAGGLFLIVLSELFSPGMRLFFEGGGIIAKASLILVFHMQRDSHHLAVAHAPSFTPHGHLG